MMRITTKFGDGGKTRICGGKVVSKCDPRIKAQGALDELISLLGLAKAKSKDAAIKKKIGLIQRDLFRITACISSGGVPRRSKGLAIRDHDVMMLERFGDSIEGRIRIPKAFVIPGVNERSAVLHVARAVARRAECCVVDLKKKFKINTCILAYLNRLSDLLFILAVYEEGKSDLFKYE